MASSCGNQKVVPWDALVAKPATRVTLRMPDAEPEAFMAHIERIGLHEVSYAVGWTAWLDINPEGVSKGSALEQLRRRWGRALRHGGGRRPAQRHRDAAVGRARGCDG
jgi:hypothetical protein